MLFVCVCLFLLRLLLGTIHRILRSTTHPQSYTPQNLQPDLKPTSPPPLCWWCSLAPASDSKHSHTSALVYICLLRHLSFSLVFMSSSTSASLPPPPCDYKLRHENPESWSRAFLMLFGELFFFSSFLFLRCYFRIKEEEEKKKINSCPVGHAKRLERTDGSCFQWRGMHSLRKQSNGCIENEMK